jgi:hypothetical protein
LGRLRPLLLEQLENRLLERLLEQRRLARLERMVLHKQQP